MMKRYLSFALIVLLLTAVGYTTQYYITAEANIALPIFKMYVFHLAACLIICLLIELLSVQLPTQVGYAYLASIFVKIGIFVLLFKPVLFGGSNLSMPEKLSIVIPLFLFLTLEAYYCGRLMGSR